MQTIDPAVEIAPTEPQTHSMFRGPAAYVPHTPWTAGWGTLASIGVFVVALLAAGAMIASISVEQVGIEVAGTLMQQAVMIAATWYVATRYGGKAYDVMALRAPAQGLKAYPIAFALLLLATVIMSNIIRLIDPELAKGDIAIFKTMFASQWWWVAFILVGIGAPLSEELLTRGFLFSALSRSLLKTHGAVTVFFLGWIIATYLSAPSSPVDILKPALVGTFFFYLFVKSGLLAKLSNVKIGVYGASLITSGLWALVHLYSPVGMAQVFVIGMLFSWVLIRTGSLRVAIVCHALYNTLMATLIVAKLI